MNDEYKKGLLGLGPWVGWGLAMGGVVVVWLGMFMIYGEITGKLNPTNNFLYDYQTLIGSTIGALLIGLIIFLLQQKHQNTLRDQNQKREDHRSQTLLRANTIYNNQIIARFLYDSSDNTNIEIGTAILISNIIRQDDFELHLYLFGNGNHYHERTSKHNATINILNNHLNGMLGRFAKDSQKINSIKQNLDLKKILIIIIILYYLRNEVLIFDRNQDHPSFQDLNNDNTAMYHAQNLGIENFFLSIKSNSQPIDALFLATKLREYTG